MKNAINTRGIWVAGLGTGLIGYALFSKNLKYGKDATLIGGITLLATGLVAMLVSRKMRS